MEKRTNERIPVSLAGELFSGDKLSVVYITDVSESGLCSIITRSNVPVDFVPKSKYDIKIWLDSGESFNLSCEERWSNKTNNDFITRIGWEVKNPPAQYTNLLKSL